MFQKLKNEPTIFLFRKMWKFSKGNHPKVILFMILFFFANITVLIEPIILAKLLNEIQANGITSENIKYLIFLATSFVWIGLLFWSFHGPARVIERTNAFIVNKKYKEYLLQKVLNFNLTWHSQYDSGDTIDKINKTSLHIHRFSQDIHRIMNICVQIIGTVIILCYFDWIIGLWCLFSTTISFIILFQFDKKLIPQYKQLNKNANNIEAKIFDSLSNISSIIILNIKKSILKNISQVIQKPFKLYRKNAILNEKKWFAGDILFNILIIAIPLTFYILDIYQNSLVIQVGTIAALYGYLSRMQWSFFNFAGTYEEMIVRKTAILNAESIENKTLENYQLKNIKSINWNKIEINDLSFSYQDTKEEIHLDNVDLQFSAGERIALIGESGSGKTTFLKVLHGLYDTAQAKIKFDDQKKIDSNFAELNLKTMLVPQEPELFSSSVKENITFGLDYSDKEIRQMTDLAEFTQTAEKLPKKFDSVINEKGVNLSGGQKQRLALSRALLFAQEKNIILLDESTSSVDPETEVKIYQNIFQHFENKTILASIHKINLLKYFDRIIMFQDGKITDSGTFDDLLETNQKFKTDWKEYSRKK